MTIEFKEKQITEKEKITREPYSDIFHRMEILLTLIYYLRKEIFMMLLKILYPMPFYLKLVI